ncbi:type I secretion system permease/ATPase [Sphingomonas sp. LB-2]|uniref:type I secretion system permease/ATPase n=1 Tax=Sphingomonas caeni TaxID=2984949 RepID=UPI0022305FBB|nr:type I secretion system permease/ATPase [Sphingomonas caeni]MCW3849419.1 type I secretion system permease/ATPase [Sphingomonas caeni]
MARPAVLRSELGSALASFRGGLIGVGVLSAMLNILTLGGSLYLMMVYDRVLPSQSLATLFALFFMIGVAYLFQGAFDVMRSQLLADIAASLDRRMTARTQAIEMRLALERPDAQGKVSPSRDLDQLRGFIASPGPSALMDLPWILFFLLVLSLVHVWLGVVTLVGAIVLGLLTWSADRVTRKHVAGVTDAANARRSLGDRNWRHAELIASLGMRERVMARWDKVHLHFLDEQARLTGNSSLLSGISKIFRLFLQSTVLTVGAILVIKGEATAGVIFASSILSGRALAPVEQAIANWKGFVTARQSWARLDALYRQVPAETGVRTILPPPEKALAVDRLVLSPPGVSRAVVADVQFSASAGQAIGIIGPSASGKSSLLRGVIGVWKPVRGAVRLDGATLDQWDGDALGRHIGYLPQSVELFAGTVAENIARFEPDAPSELVLAAAEAAGVHAMILQLSEGYETQVGEDGLNLSAGQRQRIALARALFRDPFLVALDEPNSNLDPEGEAALAAAVTGVKARGGIVLLIAHRAAILGTVDLILVMQGGAAKAFGPRDEVLARMNGKPPAPGGLTVVA